MMKAAGANILYSVSLFEIGHRIQGCDRKLLKWDFLGNHQYLENFFYITKNI